MILIILFHLKEKFIIEINLYFSIVNSGAHRIINGTCAHEDHSTSTLAAEEKCPVLRDLDLKCAYTHGNVCQISMFLLSSVLTITFTLVFS